MRGRLPGHFNRLSKLITGQVVGGKTDEADLYIEPTFIKGATADSPAMKDEIFGPILPIVNVSSIAEAIQFINKREKPLALYVFSNNQATCELVAQKTSSGGFVSNDVLMHAAGPSTAPFPFRCAQPPAHLFCGIVRTVHTEPNLPFGGVGHSGMGAYHGKLTFTIFSHRKAAIFKKQVRRI